MQIASLINLLATSPATAAANLAKGVDVTALSSGGAANTGALTDALVTQPGAVQTNPWAQFAGMLAEQNTAPATTPNIAPALADQVPATVKPNLAVPILELATKDNKPETKTDDAATTAAPIPATAIAIPPIGLYIDQQPNQNVVLTQNDTTIDPNSASKQRVFGDNSTIESPATVTSKPLPIVAEADAAISPLLANEVDNRQETAITKAPQQGKIKLAGLDTTKGPVQDADFQKAFANIIDQAKNKTTTDAAPQTTRLQGKQIATQTDDTNTKTAVAAKATATDTLTQPQQIASKIAAKIIGVKEEKISLDDNASPELQAKLDNFAAQLSTKNYAQIKEVTQALPQTAADQVQVRINQAIASGENTIKINLHPAELGAVDVDMDTDKEGNTKIRIIADKAETLQMLQHDSKHLIKSLSDVGVKADSSNLQFSLRGDQQQQNFAQNRDGTNFANQNNNNQQQANAATATYSRFTSLNEQDLISSVNNQALNILV